MRLRKWVKGVLILLFIAGIVLLESIEEPTDQGGYEQVEKYQKERGQQIIDSMRNE